MKRIVWITTAVLVITFQNAYSNTSTFNVRNESRHFSVLTEDLIVAPPVKSRAWYKKTVWKNGRARKAWVGRHFRSYRPGRYLTTARYKKIDL